MLKEVKAYSVYDYKKLRKRAYEKLNQFDLQYNDKINNTNTWSDVIEAIKLKYPKQENS